MKHYQHIVLAVELDPIGDDLPLKRVMDLIRETNSKVTLVHAIEHMSSYGAAYSVSAGADIEEMLLENSKEAMQKLGKTMGVSEDHQIIRVGPARAIVIEEAERVGADLIVLGSHGRQGMRLLLGSTANAVLHGAECDVLAVRLKQ